MSEVKPRIPGYWSTLYKQRKEVKYDLVQIALAGYQFLQAIILLAIYPAVPFIRAFVTWKRIRKELRHIS